MNYIEIMEFEGRADDYFGEFIYDSTKLENSSVRIIINSHSLNTAMPNRDKDLHSEEYMDSENFPAVTFTSHQIYRIGEHFLAKGVLKIKDVEKPVELTFHIPAKRKDNRQIMVVKIDPITILRSEFGVGPIKRTSLGQIFLGDEIKIWAQVLFKSEFEDEAALKRQFKEVPISLNELDSYTGTFTTQTGAEWFVKRFDNTLFFILPSAAVFRSLTPIGNSQFIINDIGYLLEFRVNQQNEITGLIYKRGSDKEKWWEMDKLR